MHFEIVSMEYGFHMVSRRILRTTSQSCNRILEMITQCCYHEALKRYQYLNSAISKYLSFS